MRGKGVHQLTSRLSRMLLGVAGECAFQSSICDRRRLRSSLSRSVLGPGPVSGRTISSFSSLVPVEVSLVDPPTAAHTLFNDSVTSWTRRHIRRLRPRLHQLSVHLCFFHS